MMPLRVSSLIAAIITASQMTSFAVHAEMKQTAIVKQSVTVSGSTLALSDLLDAHNAPTEALFAAPAPGQSGLIRVNRIMEAAKRAGIEKVIGDPDGSVRVTRPGRTISHAQIETALIIGLNEKGLRDPKIEETTLPQAGDLIVEDSVTSAPHIVRLDIDKTHLTFDARLTIPGSDLTARDALHITGHFADTVVVPVLTGSVSKGDTLTDHMFRMEPRDRKSLPAGSVETIAALTGQIAKTALQEGSPVPEDAIEKPVLVEKNALVTVLYNTGGLRLTMRGKAMESGSLGDMVTLINPQSRKTLFGTVTSAGTITVSSPLAPVASTQSPTALQ
jgi:flagellar basal body P-ring formation protein FlgA